jgi:hypothetical protein
MGDNVADLQTSINAWLASNMSNNNFFVMDITQSEHGYQANYGLHRSITITILYEC